MRRGKGIGRMAMRSSNSWINPTFQRRRWTCHVPRPKAMKGTVQSRAVPKPNRRLGRMAASCCWTEVLWNRLCKCWRIPWDRCRDGQKRRKTRDIRDQRIERKKFRLLESFAGPRPRSDFQWTFALVKNTSVLPS